MHKRNQSNSRLIKIFEDESLETTKDGNIKSTTSNTAKQFLKSPRIKTDQERYINPKMEKELVMFRDRVQNRYDNSGLQNSYEFPRNHIEQAKDRSSHRFRNNKIYSILSNLKVQQSDDQTTGLNLNENRQSAQLKSRNYFSQTFFDNESGILNNSKSSLNKTHNLLQSQIATKPINNISQLKNQTFSNDQIQQMICKIEKQRKTFTSQRLYRRNYKNDQITSELKKSHDFREQLQTHLQMNLPNKYRQDDIISQLDSCDGETVNLKSRQVALSPLSNRNNTGDILSKISQLKQLRNNYRKTVCVTHADQIQ